jgi:hypothetical protein
MMGLVATRAHHLSADSCQPPVPKAGFHFGDADLARADADLGRVGAPVLQVDHGFGRAHVAGDHEGCRQLLLEVGDHFLHRVGMAVRDVDGDVFRHQAFCGQAVHRVVVGLFHAQRDRGVGAARFHVFDELDVVQVKAVHHVEVAVLRHPGADLLVDHRLHVGRHHRDAKAAPAQRGAGVAFRTAFHAAFARQQQDVVVVEDFHDSQALEKTVEETEGTWTGPALFAGT